MGKRVNKFSIICGSLLLLVSCNSVRQNCAIFTLVNDTTKVVASKLLPMDWDEVYYFSDIERDSISNYLHIPYDMDNYIDVGCRFIFVKKNEIVHQEIYWDEHYYRYKIPSISLENRSFLRISNSDTVIICKDGGYYSIQPMPL